MIFVFVMCACLIDALDNWHIEVFVNQDILLHSALLLDLSTPLNILLLDKVKSKYNNGWDIFILFSKRCLNYCLLILNELHV